MKKISDISKESDLYIPIKKYLEEIGYTVKGEVKDCDMLAMQGDEMLAVELKLHLNLEVILQAVQRQKIAERVYLGVPMSPRIYRSKRFKHICHLLRRLEIGLFLVTKKSGNYNVRLEFDCVPFDRKTSMTRNKRQKNLLQKEFELRHGDHNIGGVTGKKLMTVYREKALVIAGLLLREGNQSAKVLRKLGADDKAYGILYANHYGWFKRVEPGIYGLTEKGEIELKGYQDIMEELLEKLS